MIATGDVIGEKPADEYQFRLLVTPVGPYFKGGDTTVKLCVSKYDRAAPHGTGNIKAGLNYAMSLKAGMEAHADRFVEAVKQVVLANAAWVPPFGSGATLYVRPLMIATGDVIGVKPADAYQFRILVTPVGP